MEQTSSELKLPDVLEEIVKPKSLIELYMKRDHNVDDTDEDDHGDNTDEDEKNDHNNVNQESQSVKFLPTNRIGLEKR